MEQPIQKDTHENKQSEFIKSINGLFKKFLGLFKRSESDVERTFRKLKRVELVELIFRLRTENVELENENIRIQDDLERMREQYIEKIDKLEKVCEDLRAELEHIRGE